MEVSLKKAHKIQKDLEAIIFRYSSSVSKEISVYMDLTEDKLSKFVEDELTKLKADFDKGVEITKWIYAIRADICRINHEVGIDALLTDLALNGKLLSMIGKSVGDDVDIPVTLRKLEMIKKRLESTVSDAYSPQLDYVRLNLTLNNEDRVKALRREKVNIEDQLTALNAKTMVSLSDDVETFLKSEGLI